MRIIGHRGLDLGKEKEMSADAYHAAMEIGVDKAECDVQACQDELVVFHDDTTDRVTGKSGRVSGLTLKELRERYPALLTLDEYLDIVHEHATIEIKDTGTEIVDRVMKHVDSLEEKAELLVWDVEQGIRARELSQKVEVSLLVMQRIDVTWLAWSKETGALTLQEEGLFAKFTYFKAKGCTRIAVEGYDEPPAEVNTQQDLIEVYQKDKSAFSDKPYKIVFSVLVKELADKFGLKILKYSPELFSRTKDVSVLRQCEIFEAGRQRVLELAIKQKISTLSFEDDDIPEAYIKQMKSHGVSIAVWTVNDKERMQALIAMGVDAITTDNPAELKAQLTHITRHQIPGRR